MTNARAVILAGGRGERVAPISNTLPKALIPLHGKPMIAYQIEQLQRLGFKEVVILTGYLGESIRSYCGTLNLEIKIICIESDVNATPAERLLSSLQIIGNCFLLTYCDNYILDDNDIFKVLQSQTEITFLAEPRDKGNIAIEQNSNARYFSGPRNQLHGFVELGNIKINYSNFFQVLDSTKDLQIALEIISSEITCNAVVTSKESWSISNLNRILNINKNRKILMLDRDGILLEKMPHREYLTSFSDYKPIHENWVGLRNIGNLGFDFVIVTNQPGVGTGQISESFLSEVHVRLVSELMNFGVNILAVYSCKHHWQDNCYCRKPKAGLLNQAISDFKIDRNHTLYIGDEDKDREAAINAKIGYQIVSDNHDDSKVFPNIAAAQEEILKAINKVG